MCNAHNHSPNCTCGWGGDGHLGGGDNFGRSATQDLTKKESSHSRSYNWGISGGEGFYRPTTCPICGAIVYFVRHNGGSVWLDSLGNPWPKHPCFNDDFPQVREKLSEVNAKDLCLVTEVAVINLFEKGIITVINSSGTKLTGTFTYNGDIKNWLGQVVHIDKENNSDTIECNELTKIYGNFTTFFSFTK